MENSSSNVAGSSSHASSNRGIMSKQSSKFICRVHGIPKKCWCGSGVVEKISGTEENPCRRYYRCGFAAANKLRHDRHVFKWVDEAYHNEIEQLSQHVVVLEDEVKLLKNGSNVGNAEGNLVHEMENMQIEVLGSVDEMLVNANRSIRWLVGGVFAACLLMVVLVIILKK